jgi:hypothetical protein
MAPPRRAFGCVDMGLRLLRLFPELPEAGETRQVLNHNLSPGNIQAEVGYLQAPNRNAFERTYGWAWLLKPADVSLSMPLRGCPPRVPARAIARESPPCSDSALGKCPALYRVHQGRAGSRSCCSVATARASAQARVP